MKMSRDCLIVTPKYKILDEWEKKLTQFTSKKALIALNAFSERSTCQRNRGEAKLFDAITERKYTQQIIFFFFWER